jgi:hypothetical protein
MDAGELADANRKLRRFAEDHGMRWVVDEVDEAISFGVAEVKELREARRDGRTVYEELSTPGRGGKRAQEFITRRPMTELEQADALITAFRRVLVDLDEVASMSVDQLNDAMASVDDNVELVSEIVFEPDDGSTAPRVTTEVVRYERRRQRVSDLLGEIHREIHS